MLNYYYRINYSLSSRTATRDLLLRTEYLTGRFLSALRFVRNDWVGGKAKIKDGQLNTGSNYVSQQRATVLPSREQLVIRFSILLKHRYYKSPLGDLGVNRCTKTTRLRIINSTGIHSVCLKPRHTRRPALKYRATNLCY